jgi:hypothetical protein
MTSGPQLTNSLLRRAGPPGRGDFCFGDFTHAPSRKSLSKNGFCPKGVAFLTEGVFEKKLIASIALYARRCGRQASDEHDSHRHGRGGQSH